MDKKKKPLENNNIVKSQDDFFNQLGPEKAKKSTLSASSVPNSGLKKVKRKKIHILSKKVHTKGHKTAPKVVPFDPNRTNTKLQEKIGIPNILTLIRLFLVIPFVVCLSIPLFYWGSNTVAGGELLTHVPSYSDQTHRASLILFLVSGVIFILAMITDYFDGRIARKKNIVTTFGKIFDPIADKAITLTALVFLSLYNIVPFYLTIIIIARDLLVDGFRMAATSNGVVIPASKLGKWKTVAFSVGIGMLFFVVPFWSYFSVEHHLFSPEFPGIMGWTHKVGSELWFSDVLKLGWMLNYFVMLPIFIGTTLSLVSGFNYFRKVKKFINLRAYINEDNKSTK